jgi:hypothetical protein
LEGREGGRKEGGKGRDTSEPDAILNYFSDEHGTSDLCLSGVRKCLEIGQSTAFVSISNKGRKKRDKER